MVRKKQEVSHRESLLSELASECESPSLFPDDLPQDSIFQLQILNCLLLVSVNPASNREKHPLPVKVYWVH